MFRQNHPGPVDWSGADGEPGRILREELLAPDTEREESQEPGLHSLPQQQTRLRPDTRAGGGDAPLFPPRCADVPAAPSPWS